MLTMSGLSSELPCVPAVISRLPLAVFVAAGSTSAADVVAIPFSPSIAYIYFSLSRLRLMSRLKNGDSNYITYWQLVFNMLSAIADIYNTRA